VGFLVALLGTMLLAGAWWLEAFAVLYAADKRAPPGEGPGTDDSSS
jgi:hypothetical protein